MPVAKQRWRTIPDEQGSIHTFNAWLLTFSDRIVPFLKGWCPMTTAVAIEMAVPELVRHNYGIETDTPIERVEEMCDELVSFLDETAAGLAEARPPDHLDKLWHTFILHSRLYTEFCMERYGRYMHHNPRRKHSKEDCCGCD